MSFSTFEKSRLILAGLSVTGLLAACVATPPKPETATVVTAVKTPVAKTVTNFTPALRCMDDLMLAYGKKDIVITTAGIPDSTGKVMAGTKEMLISAAMGGSPASRRGGVCARSGAETAPATARMMNTIQTRRTSYAPMLFGKDLH